MTKNNLFLLLGIMAAGMVQAQDSTRVNPWNQWGNFYAHPLRTEMSRSMAFITADGEFDASSINNTMSFKLATGRRLETSLIAENAGRQKAKNLVGYDVDVSAGYVSFDKPLFNKKNLFWYASYGYRDFLASSYSDHLFTLVGIGNKAFEGDTADANAFRIDRSRYDYLSAGVIKYFGGERPSNLKIGVGVVRGINHLTVDAKRLQLYTAPYGEYLNVDADVDVRRHNYKNGSGYGTYNGTGAMIDAEYNIRMSPGSAITVGVRNLGFVRWKDGYEYSKDSSFRFDGWSVPDYGALKDSSGAAIDSLINVFRPKTDSAGFTALLPANFYLRYTMELNKANYLTFAMQKTLFSAMLARISISYTHFSADDKWYLSTTVATGGVGRFALHQEVSRNFGKGIMAQVKLYNIDGLVLPASASGFGCGLGVYKVF